MLPALHRDPAIEPAGALTAVVVFRNQAFVPHQECGAGFRQLRTRRRTRPGQLRARCGLMAEHQKDKHEPCLLFDGSRL